MTGIEQLIPAAALLIAVSVLASKASTKIGLPALLIFIVMGMLAGSEGLGGVYFDNAPLAKAAGVLALSIILFAGGLGTDIKAVKPVVKEGLALAVAGTVFTALVAGLFAHFALGFSLPAGLLLGSVLSSTDAAAVFAALRGRSANIRPGLRGLLELESGSNDPTAVFLTVGMIGVISASGAGYFLLLPAFVLEMSIGLAAGWLMARLMLYAINRLDLDYEGLYSVFTLALVLLTYYATALLKGNGFLAVYVAGLVMAGRGFLHKKPLLYFHEGIAWLMQIAMFLALGLLVYPSRLAPVAWKGLAISFVLIFVARPLAVFVSLAPFRLGFREKLFISWVGLRGAAPIVLATFPLIAGVKGSDLIFNIVFFCVLTSALLQGTTIAYAARLLGLAVPAAEARVAPIALEDGYDINAQMTEFIVQPGSRAAGRKLFEVGVPKEALIVLIFRDSKYLIPSGETEMLKGDILISLGDQASLETLKNLVSTEAGGEKG
ncbi:MAG: potassium/proton antiporter [Elusimicrobiota bacterium]